MTSAPTTVPSKTPSDAPSSTIPSALPTITGSVVFIELKKEVTSSLTASEIDAIVKTTEEAFDIFPGNVEASVTYEITGTVAIAVDGDYNAEELVEALKASIASSLNIHASDVSVSIDPDSGIVSYEISSATAEQASQLQNLLQTQGVNNAISANVANAVAGVTGVAFF